MKKILLVCLIVLIQTQTKAQEPAPESAEQAPANEATVGTITNSAPKIQKPLGRVKSSTGVNPESSSFIGDPDNIDPLKANRDNIKEDEEPVLEDIKQIIDAPKKKPEVKVADSVASGDSTHAAPEVPPPVEITPSAPGAAPVAAPNETPPAGSTGMLKNEKGLTADDPDLVLEKKFNTIFKRYNINPTPDDIWAAATSKQVLREYVVQKGDTLWSISKILFDDPNFWPKIWAINKQGILNPHFIYPKSKIYFYMGDEESAPTLSVGAPAAPVEGVEKTEEAGEEAPSANQESSLDEVAQAEPTEATNSANGEAPVTKPKKVLGRPPAPPVTHTKVNKGDRPSKIPQSLPLSRNGKYFSPPTAQEIKIELGQYPRFDYEFVSDIVITDRVVTTDVLIKIAETTKFRCYDGRIIRDIRYVGALVEDYDVFERLSDIKTTAGTMYAYRKYGQAKPYQGKYLKFTSCRSLLLTDLVIVAKEKIQTFKNNQLSPSRKPVLIGGPDVIDQNLFATNQVAYIDFGTFAYQPGQEFKVMSQITDEVNGIGKVLEKYGSFGVVVLTDVNDIIAIGDKVILN